MNNSLKPKEYPSKAALERSAKFESTRAAGKVAQEQALANGTLHQRLNLIGQLWNENRLKNGHAPGFADMIVNDESYDPLVGQEVVQEVMALQHRLRGTFAENGDRKLNDNNYGEEGGREVA